MKNKFLIGTITFLVTLIAIIFFFNFFDSNSKKNYKLNRKYNNDTYSFKFEKNYPRMSKFEYLMSTVSNKF